MKIYNVHTLTLEQLTDLIASGDDTKATQIRIKNDGSIFLSNIVGNNSLDGIAGRFETFDANNGYIGKEASMNEEYIKSLYLTIQKWLTNPASYIDVWVQV